MDVERLRMLRELADRGTIRAVADALSLTPSAVSQQLKRLQREVGIDLLEPKGRRLRLTEAGKALVTRADEVVAALDRAQADMDTFRTELARDRANRDGPFRCGDTSARGDRGRRGRWDQGSRLRRRCPGLERA